MIKKCFVLCALTTGTVLVADPGTTYSPQDAIEFFSKELEYKVGSYDVKQIIERKEKGTPSPEDKNTVIVDVRDEESFKKGHIPGALNVPNGDLKDGLEAPFTKENIIIVYCYKWDCDLAKVAAIKLIAKDYKVKELSGGFNTWKENKDNPIEK